MEFISYSLDKELLIKIILSILLGLIIGLEREHKAKEEKEVFVGIRTFPLITVLGCLSALIYENYFEGIFYFTFGALILFTIIKFYLDFSRDRGVTTEVTAIISFLIGVLTYYNYIYIAVFLTIIITFLLALKTRLETFAKGLSQEDIFSILKFILITIVVYPLLPDKDFGPFNAFNLKDIWKVVIIVSTLDFIGYVLLKWKGGKVIWITGVIGGLVSSTAVSYELAKKSKEIPSITESTTVGIALAWAIMNIRVLVLSSLFSYELTKSLAIPLLITTLIYLVIIFVKYKDEFIYKKETQKEINIENPYDIWSAIQFGIIYAVVLFVIKALKFYIGSTGIYIGSFISGVIDVDAITLSLSQMVKDNPSFLEIAIKGILIAVISNSFFKYGYIFAFGNKTLSKNMLIFLTVITIICGFFIIFV
ncbi:MgtC/SapB family protein [Hydrogenothermus marinus]|uniref:Uncharacterized membrane protein (DUF4010 family) n=1 Tax=Hydrogenothermus marinus TaxID=133270 RepID=A0A3M0BIE5_9AQUI|nr:MgtC/SapB family protein [Hydrogenothermus marinus]RMA96144.1 uncharacterized membrane protein (DUF4010 family) [Hydrogenothermus marinus]